MKRLLVLVGLVISLGLLQGCSGMSRLQSGEGTEDRMVYTEIDPAKAHGFQGTIGTYYAPCAHDRTGCKEIDILFTKTSEGPTAIGIGDMSSMNGRHFYGGKGMDLANNLLGRAVTGGFGVEQAKEYAKKDGGTYYNDERTFVATTTEVGVRQNSACTLGGDNPCK
jgi:hypothetical protein